MYVSGAWEWGYFLWIAYIIHDRYMCHRFSVTEIQGTAQKVISSNRLQEDMQMHGVQ